jgi:hypothetical protein
MPLSAPVRGHACRLVVLTSINATNHYGNVPFREGDPLQPIEAFWQHVDHVVNKAASLGLTIALVPDRTLIVNKSDYANGKWGKGPLTALQASTRPGPINWATTVFWSSIR